MNEKKLKHITRADMWLAAIVGSINGLLFTIAGYLLDWGPGGSMQGPFWRVLIVGMLSILTAAYIGEFLVRKLGKTMLEQQLSLTELSIRSFAITLVGSITAFIVGWEVGFIAGKITGAIEGLEWIPVLVYAPLMSLIYGIPISLIASFLFGIFVFLYGKSGNE
jgi:hypothetical protein